MSIRQTARRLSIEARDVVVSRKSVRALTAQYLILRAGDPPPGDDRALVRTFDRLCYAAQLAPAGGRQQRRVEARLSRLVGRFDPARVDWGAVDPEFGRKPLTKTAVLKPWVGPREKGVVYVAFPYNFLRLFQATDLRGFADHYHLVVASSWSPPHQTAVYALAAGYPGPVFTTLSNPRDLDDFPRISPKFVPVNLYASSWVHPDFFRPAPRADRDIDLVMVANFAKFKRHHALFRALRSMPAGLRVVLIGQDQDGRTDATVAREAALYGVAGRFTLLRDQPYAEVARLLGRAKASVVLSRREGSCVVVAESLFADTPVAVLEDAVIGSKTFINDRTGRLLRHRDLGPQLTAFVAESDRYAARAWADENISFRRSTHVLNAALRDHALKAGGEWTRDIVPMCRCPNAVPLAGPAAAELERERAAIAERFGIRIVLPPTPPLLPPARPAAAPQPVVAT